MQSSGALTRIGATAPSLFGMPGTVRHLNRVAGECAGVAQGHVDAAVDGGGRSREVEADSRPGDLRPAGETKRIVDPLDVDCALVRPVGQGRDPVADGPFALSANRLGERGEVLESVLVHEVEKLAPPDLVAGHVRHEVAEDLLGHPYVAADDVEHRLVEPARAYELADGEAQALVIDLRCGGPEPEAPDIREVSDADRVADNAATSKHRAHHVDVEKMSGPHPRVVGGNDVARLQGLGRELREHVAQGRGGGAGERRDAVAALGDGVSLRVEHHHREVAALAHDGGERAPNEGGDDLVGDPDESIPQDGEVYRVDRIGFHRSLPLSASSATRLRRSSTVARSPGPSTQVDSRSSMTAGPATVIPTSSP